MRDIDNFVYPIIVAVSAITTFLTPIMIKSSGYMYKLAEKYLPQKWKDYIDQSAKPGVTTVTEEKLWKLLFKSYFLRMFLLKTCTLQVSEQAFCNRQ